MTGEQKAQARRLLDDGCPVAEVARTVGVDPKTVTRWFPDAPRMTHAERTEWATYCKRHGALVGGTNGR